MATTAENAPAGALAFVLLDTVSISRTVVLAISLFCAYTIASCLYLIRFHPLADVPGPSLCAISRIPYWRANFGGNDVRWLHDLHNKYGPVVRFGPTDLSYATAAAWKDIHGYGKGKSENGKAQEFSVQPVNGVPSMLTATFDDHARVRRLFSPAFSDRALKKQEPLFKGYVKTLLSKLGEVADRAEPVEMTQILNFATFDTMAQLCFGHSLGLLERNELSPWVRSIFESLKMLPMASFIAYYPLLNSVFTRFEPKFVTEQRQAHCQHSAERVNQRLQEGSDQPDIWNLVISAQETGNALTLEEMHSNAELFMLAGSETTATLLSGLIYLLLTNPEPSNRLTEEIRARFQSVEDMTFDSLAECKYLTACLKEALRVYPPVPIGSPRVIPEGGQLILGKWIPAETRVSVHHYSTYHSSANFQDPETFAPERWLGNPRYADDERDAHQPFGWGHRNCLGQNMAMHEMRLILAAVLLSFSLQLDEQSRHWLHQNAYALWIKKPLMCKVNHS